MTAQASTGRSSGPEQPTLGRRMYRAIVFAAMVGGAGAVLSAVPTLFIQSIYIGEAQRCIELQQKDIAITGEIETECAERLNDAPVWLPPTILAGGTLMGALGGFAYGFFAPKTASKRSKDREIPWLPF